MKEVLPCKLFKNPNFALYCMNIIGELWKNEYEFLALFVQIATILL
jgi:hypothetical protein